MKTILLLFFMMIGLIVQSQTSADGYFNSGAQDFIHNELEKAIATIDQGLKKFPNDENLNELKEKLIEEKKKQDQKQKQNGGKKKENQDKKSNDKKESEQNQDKKDEENKDQNKDKENEDSENKKKEEQKPQPKPEVQQGQMTPQQIKQLLETMNNEEAKTQKKVNAQKVKGKKVQQEKDW
ncbi:hypothetical protein [Flavicella sp.]|uniref:hypothetical protein n=1 Tax=Flavicella sp. TaxID=2957742 RepID=UPI0026050B6C|nr:hypothetical protein [Flavicella sp.]MDG1804324.1 hypothetical protein [Flavicella sp.]MDG2280790.1 hypothetical protein [Flavicella sp.]